MDTPEKNSSHTLEQESAEQSGKTMQDSATSTQSNSSEEACKEQLIRLSADFTNYKKRVERERSEWMLAAQSGVLEKILPIFDELDRALQLAQQQADEGQAWLKGIMLIQKNWQKALTDLGVQEIPTQGIFNPELHEALMHEAKEGQEAGTIGQTFSKGYQFRGKVIRHAKVSVIK